MPNLASMCSLWIFVLEDGKVFIRKKGGKEHFHPKEQYELRHKKMGNGRQACIWYLTRQVGSLGIWDCSYRIGPGHGRPLIPNSNLWIKSLGEWLATEDAGLKESYNKDFFGNCRRGEEQKATNHFRNARSVPRVWGQKWLINIIVYQWAWGFQTMILTLIENQTLCTCV